MKNLPLTRKPETIEDIVFEGRNRSYGAYELNKKRSKYLLIAFMVSFAGVSTSIAVPFFNMKNKPLTREISEITEVCLIDVNTEKPEVPLPPEPPKVEIMQSQLVYRVPEVVEEVLEPELELSIGTIEQATFNPPPDIDIPVISDQNSHVIEEPEEEIVFFPQEEASFNGGTVSDFCTWVQTNLGYPEEPAAAGIEGKVIIEFCVNSKGEVVDIKVLRKIHPDIDNETVEVISSSPVWKPAKQGGRPVKQRFTIPITFEIL